MRGPFQIVAAGAAIGIVSWDSKKSAANNVAVRFRRGWPLDGPINAARRLMDTTRSLFAVSWNQFRAGHTALTSTSRCLTDGSADRFPEKCIFMPLLRSWCLARIYKHAARCG